MPASQITRARILVDEERELPLTEQLARWTDRHAAAKDWELVCRIEVSVLTEALQREASRLEVDRVLEAPAPPSA